MNDTPKVAYKTTDPTIVAAFTDTAEQVRDIQNRAVAEAEKIGGNNGLMVSRAFGDLKVIGLAVGDPANPPEGWRYVRERFEPRRGKPGEQARAWLDSIQPPSVRDVMAQHGLPRNCSLKFGFFGSPGIFMHAGAVYAIYKGGPDGGVGPSWVSIRPSEYYAAQEQYEDAQKSEAVNA